jgi:hypothetical protein
MASRRKLLRDQRGTSSIEAAVMLPIMAVCWAGLMLRFEQVESYMTAATSARRDAWVFSNSGCEDDPPGKTADLKVDCVSGAGEGNFSWADAVRSIPVVGFFVDTIFGFKFKATGHQDFTQPMFFGGKSKTARYPYALMCNEKSRSGGEVLGQVLVQTIDSLGLGFGISDSAKPPNRRGSCE